MRDDGHAADGPDFHSQLLAARLGITHPTRHKYLRILRLLRTHADI